MATNSATVSKAVLITGCSSGIGKTTAEHLARAGWTVYATARKIDGLEGLAAAGCRVLPLDVTDEASMSAAVAEIERAAGAVGVLINNAGYSQSGAIKTVDIDLIRKQFETNVFGLVRLTQLVLPGMRRQGWGKVVNISSMGGKLTFPGGGFYHASKYAVEAVTDALRFEVAGFGIDAILIEPGIIKTNFGETAAAGIGAAKTVPGDPYAGFNEAVAKTTRAVYEEGVFAKLGGDPEAVAETIEKAISGKRPRARYRVDWAGRLLLTQRALMPDVIWDRFVGTQFPRPSREA